jgi:hypothetical protein
MSDNVKQEQKKIPLDDSKLINGEFGTITNTTPVVLDSVVTSIINKFKSRAEFGQKKYGTNLDRTDLSVLDWIQHAQEEHMDAILYLEKLKKELQNKSENKKEESSSPVTSSNKKELDLDLDYYNRWGC